MFRLNCIWSYWRYKCIISMLLYIIIHTHKHTQNPYTGVYECSKHIRMLYRFDFNVVITQINYYLYIQRRNNNDERTKKTYEKICIFMYEWEFHLFKYFWLKLHAFLFLQWREATTDSLQNKIIDAIFVVVLKNKSINWETVKKQQTIDYNRWSPIDGLHRKRFRLN